MKRNKYLSNGRLLSLPASEKVVNVNIKSTESLGKALSLTYPKQFTTIVGVAACIKNFLDYLTKVDYPIDLLSKTSITKKDLVRIPKKTNMVINYWSMAAYALTERIKQDTKLFNLIKENKLEYTSFNSTTNMVVDNVEVEITVPDLKMCRYISIIRHIDYLIKNDLFDEANITELINNCKNDATKSIFAGTKLEP